MIEILIADDHQLIREGFKKLIGFETDMEVVAEAKTANEVLEFLGDKKCDVIVLDINFPDRSGLDLLGDLSEHYPDIKVLILSMNPEDRFAIRALKNGASGYLTKEMAGDELVKAIHKVMSGRKYISSELAEILASGLYGNSLPHTNLSDREFQVFLLLGAGKPQNEIVVDLSLSLSTINTYRKRIMDKMHFKNNSDIIRYTIKNNLVD